MHTDSLHAARLAMLEAALLALLHEAGTGADVTYRPDGVHVRFHADGLDVDYMRGDRPVSGEGI